MKLCRCVKCNRSWYEGGTNTLPEISFLTVCNSCASNYTFMTPSQEKEYLNKLNKKE